MQAIGLIFSVALHGALLFWAALEILGTSELPEPAAPTIEAEIISISEFTKLKQGDPESKKLVAKAAPEVEPQVSKKEAPRPKPPKPTPPPAAEEPPPKPPEPEPPKAETPPLQPDKIAEKFDSSSPPVPAPPDVDAAARKKKAEIQRKYKEKLRKEAERKRKLAEKKRREAKKKKKAEKKRKEQDFTKRMAALLDNTPEERGSRRSGSSL